MGRIRWRKEVTDEEDDQDEFDGGADWIVLITGLDIPDQHGRARQLMKATRDLIDISNHHLLRVLELHTVSDVANG